MLSKKTKNSEKMIKYISIFLILLGAVGIFPAQKRTNLDEDWRFHFGHSEDAKADFNYSLVNIFSKLSPTFTGTYLIWFFAQVKAKFLK